MKKAEIKVVRLKRPKNSDVLNHFDAACMNACNQCGKGKMQGYALVTFHGQEGYIATFHTKGAGIHHVDLPEMVKNRLLEAAINLSKE